MSTGQSPGPMGLVWSILSFGFIVLNVVAVYKVITKAGYSGSWILLFLAPFAAYLIAVVVMVHEIGSGSVHFARIADWFALAGLLLFIDDIFFIVFAFADWPALRQQRQSYGPGYRYGGPGVIPPSPGARPGMPRPVGGHRLASGPTRGWQDGADDTRVPQGNRWPDPWGRSRPARPRPPGTGESEGGSSR
jgi:hypothetical protein